MRKAVQCVQCGASLADRYATTLYCTKCSTVRQRESTRRSQTRAAGTDVPYHCVGCGAEKEKRRPVFCPDCIQRRPVRTLIMGQLREATKAQALAMVADAKRLGLLPELDGAIACVDCGNVATEYDHRDYKYPLFVQPVCRTCNNRRGPAAYLTLVAPDAFKAPRKRK